MTTNIELAYADGQSGVDTASGANELLGPVVRANPSDRGLKPHGDRATRVAKFVKILEASSHPTY